MSVELNIIGDIAGNFRAFDGLIKKMPKDATVVSLGDMVDRGPQSKDVISFIKENGLAIMGNHEHMLIDFCDDGDYYADDIWLNNGGYCTLMSYGARFSVDGIELTNKNRNFWFLGKVDCLKDAEIPSEHLDWLRQLPFYLEYDDIILTHAPINPSVSFERTQQFGENAFDNRCETSLLWNRGGVRRMNKFQVHGHNAVRNVNWIKDKQGDFCVNLDTSNSKYLTGMHWPSRKIFQEEI